MKNINSFMGDSSVVELNSTELNEIVGGNLWTDIKEAWHDAKIALITFLLSL